ncbi:hypothetical protein SH668x_000261 [Planctomicrobium sp. SH668]|uniref:hypothetical protein n=1 Tax=Planctomicrobium sp. SH668 TaxID=3448126 RepID=UPI003F5C28ED
MWELWGKFMFFQLASTSSFSTPILKTINDTVYIYPAYSTWVYSLVFSLISLAVLVIFAGKAKSSYDMMNGSKKKRKTYLRHLLVNSFVASTALIIFTYSSGTALHNLTKYVKVTPTSIEAGGFPTSDYEFRKLDLTDVRYVDREMWSQVQFGGSARYQQAEYSYRLVLRKNNDEKLSYVMDDLLKLAYEHIQKAHEGVLQQARTDRDVENAERIANQPPIQNENGNVSAYYGPELKIYAESDSSRKLTPSASLMQLKRGDHVYLPTNQGGFENAEVLDLYEEGFIKFRFLGGTEAGKEFTTLHEYDRMERHFESKPGNRVVLVQKSGSTGRYDSPDAHLDLSIGQRMIRSGREGRGPSRGQRGRRGPMEEFGGDGSMIGGNGSGEFRPGPQSQPEQSTNPQPSPQNPPPNFAAQNNPLNRPVPEKLNAVDSVGGFKPGVSVKVWPNIDYDFTEAEVLEVYREHFLKIRISPEHSSTQEEVIKIVPFFGLRPE